MLHNKEHAAGQYGWDRRCHNYTVRKSLKFAVYNNLRRSPATLSNRTLILPAKR